MIEEELTFIGEHTPSDSTRTRKPEPMSEQTLSAIIDAELQDAISYTSGSGSQIAAERAKAMDAYVNAPLGDERPGHSQVQASDVQDTVESILPSLLKIFFSGDEIVKYEPRTPDDEDSAKQATDYINFIVNNDNQGFLAFYTWFKDALLQRNGYLFPYWKMEERSITQSYTGLDEDSIALLLQDEGVELISVTPNEEMQEAPMPSMPMQPMEMPG